MKTIKLENLSVESSDESYEKLKKQLMPKSEWRFVPEKGEIYFTVDGREIHKSTWTNHDVDKLRLYTDNVFRNEEEAEKHLEKIKARADIIDYMYANDMILIHDWKDGNQEKYVLSYDNSKETFWVDSSYNIHQLYPLPFINSIKNAEKLIDKKEKELRIIFDLK